MEKVGLKPEVLELIDFIESGSLLSGVTQGNSPEAWMVSISSFEKAEFYATDQHGRECSVWGDLIENTSGELMGDLYGTDAYREGQSTFDEIDEYLNGLIWDTLDGKFDELILNNSTGFFSMFLKVRYFTGVGDHFLEKVFRGFKTGGWPCGWINGSYPNGKMVIYIPES